MQKRLRELLVALGLLAGVCACFAPTHSRNAGTAEGTGEPLLLNGFDSLEDVRRVRVRDGFTSATLHMGMEQVHSGAGSLALGLEEGGLPGLPTKPTPRVTMEVPATPSLSEYRALAFSVYVPEGLPSRFFGRRDIQVKLNDSTHVSSADPSTRGETQWAAVRPGWNHYLWEFADFEELGPLENLEIQFGPLLEGYGKGTLYLDTLRLIPADPLPDGRLTVEAMLEEASWSRRYRALEHFAARSPEEALQAVVAFAGDPSRAVRGRAVEAMEGLAAELGDAARPMLESGLADDNWRVRLSCLKLLARSEGELAAWGVERIEAGLLDPNFYVRDFSRDSMREFGRTAVEIVESLREKLKKAEGSRQPLLLALAELRGDARQALPDVLALLRDDALPLDFRQWALRSAWEIDEAPLTPEDWVLGLELQPGEIHRHLLNRTMQRLEASGEKAVPVLMEALDSELPRVRARAAVLLGRIGREAHGAIPALTRSSGDPESHVAWEAQQALAAIEDRKLSLRTAPLAGKAPGDSPPVQVEEDEQKIRCGNGEVELVFYKDDDSPGPAVVRLAGGENLTQSDWLPNILAFRYSNAPAMIERQWLQHIFGSPFPRRIEREIVEARPEQFHYRIDFVPEGEEPIAWSYHYALRRGDSGFYTWIDVRNVSGRTFPNSDLLTADTGLGRYNHLVGLSWEQFDYVYIHDLLKGPARFADHPSQPFVERWPDIYQSCFRTPSGEIFAKHEWENYHYVGNVNGYAGGGAGLWVIYPSLDFFGDSMPRHQATSAWGSIFVPHWEGKYYSNVTPLLTADWRKTYGPVFIYLNHGEDPEALWSDAKRQALVEQQAWPYSWMDSPGYHDRGTLTGEAVLADGQAAAGGYVLLSNPNEPADPGQIHLWMRNIAPYQYWSKVAEDGRFRIEDVRTGEYELYLFQPGVHGELHAGTVSIAGGATVDAGRLVLRPISRGELVWQIGVPDGTTMEFRNGQSYHQWDTYTRYRQDFPEDVTYVPGESDWRRDWNYIHPAAVLGEEQPVRWRILFDLVDAPTKSHLLSIVAGARSASVDILVNGNSVGRLAPSVGWHHIRTCPVGEQALREFEISPDLLHSGKNEIVLAFPPFDQEEDRQRPPHFRQWTRWVAYDFLRLERLQDN